MAPRFEQVLSSLRKWPKFFPPVIGSKIPEFLQKLRYVQEKDQYTDLMQHLGMTFPDLIQCMIEDDLKQWFQKRLAPDPTKPCSDWDKDGLEAFATAIGDALDMINVNENLLLEYNKHIAKLNVNYLETIFDCLDANMRAICDDCVTRLDDFMDDPKMAKVHDQLSKISMRLFCSIKNTSIFSARHPLGKVRKMCDYETWFHVSLENWINTWCTTSIAYTLTMIQNDNDFVKASDRSLYLESAVNLLSLCKGISNDYLRVQFEIHPIRTKAIVDICNTICKCVEAYAENLGQKLKQTRLPKHVDIKDLVFCAANSVEYVGIYTAENLLQFLDTENSLKTIDGADSIRANHAARIEACVKMAIHFDEKQLDEHIREALPLPEENKTKKEKVNHRVSLKDFRGGLGLLKYLDGMLVSLEDALLPTLFSPVTSLVFEYILTSIKKQFESGQRNIYYRNIKAFMDSLDDYFRSIGTDYLLDSRIVHEDLRKTVTLCSFSTYELLLEFYYIESMKQCTIVRSGSSQCHLNVRLGWKNLNENQRQIHVHLINGRNMPLLDMRSSDIYIRLSLDPFCLFNDTKYAHVDSEVKWKTLNPDYDRVFIITADEASCNIEGAVLTLTAYDKDRTIGMKDDLGGQAFVSIKSIEEIPDGKDIQDMPVLKLPLSMPTEENVAYIVLRDRRGWDKVAKSFVNFQSHLIEEKSKPNGSSELRNLSVTSSYSTGISGAINRWMRRDSEVTSVFVA